MPCGVWRRDDTAFNGKLRAKEIPPGSVVLAGKKTGKRYATILLPASRQAIIDAGGLIPYTRQQLVARK